MTGPAAYDPILVALSIVIAMGASYTALDLAERVTNTHGKGRRWWLFGGALSMGLGIWSMHFTGMLAYQTSVPMTYGLVLTGLSLLLAIGASWAALFVVSRRSLTWRSLLAGSFLMGSGILSMHYVGMAAMRMPCVLSYAPSLVVLSGVIAVSASLMALWTAFRLRETEDAGRSPQKLGSAALMGVAIAGMHYTGMAAATLSPLVCQPTRWPSVNMSQLGGVAIGCGTLIVLAIVLLNAYRERLQFEQDLLKDRFLSILTHELRTPLNAILGFGSILEDGLAGPLTAPQFDYVRKINKGAEHLLSLVDDLLDMSRIQAGKFTINPEPLHVAALVDEVQANLAPLAAKKQIHLYADMPPDLPDMVADPQRVRQVLLNLIGNAIKFTEPGGSVAVLAHRAGDAVCFEVSDTGIGIAAHDLPKLFAPFTQLDMSSTRKAGGAGLGLSISKALVEAHHGQIGVDSTPEHGSTFYFTLPIDSTLKADAESRSPSDRWR